MNERRPKVIDISKKEKKMFEGGGYDQTAVSKRDEGADLTVHLGTISPGKTHDWHDHEQDEVMYIVRGSGKYLLKDGEMAYQAGNFVFMPRKTSHKNVVTSQEDVKIIAIFNPAQF